MVLVVMGVAGSGKTVVGASLARALAWQFADADTFHSAANVEKMSHGKPLTDEDRWPWLESVAHAIDAWLSEGANGIMACSALKQSYRDVLSRNHPEQIKVVYLKGSYQLFEDRLSHRQDHFMKSNMLKSQFAALEEPADAIVVDAALPVDKIVALLAAYVSGRGGTATD